ncbi:MAG: Lrp/AsnC ligand binding domain-containing protein [Gammaproteobacteria bacterium]|nr:Lrp/AsnC ligand binding domain-containing protein [Gammaproteobacteria bacterium]
MKQNVLDSVDKNILRELQNEGRLSVVELANRVHLTKTPCAERVRRLEKIGYIKGYQAMLAADRLGCAYESFVQVTLSHTTTDILNAFNQAVAEIDEVQSCHMIAGGFDYLLKVRTRDVAHYREVLGSTLATLPGVQQTHTYVVMESVKDESRLVIK